MKVKRLFQRIASGAMAGIMLVSSLAGMPSEKVWAADVPAKMDTVSSVNYDYILSRAVDFGVTAQTFVQEGHMETTFATNKFIHEASNSDVDFITGTAQFLIGGVGIKRDNTKSDVVFGNTTCSVFNIEASEDVLGKYTHINGNPVAGGQEIGRIHFNSSVPSVVLTKTDATSGNIDRIIKNAEERSNELSARANSDEYCLDYSQYTTINGTQALMNIDQPDFEEKVVYINVDQALADCIKETSGLKIIKRPSTVIVFNIEDKLKDGSDLRNSTVGVNYNKWQSNTVTYDDAEKTFRIAKMEVSVDGGKSWTQTETGRDKKDEYMAVDTNICQKVIWNIRTKGLVDLNTAAGVFIAPYDKDLFSTGSSAGWVIANRVTVQAGEWHYIYQRASQDIITDGNGQIHFAARKAFANGYDSKGMPVEDKSVKAEEGDYKFNWYESDKNYKLVNLIDTVENQATNKVHFPVLTFKPEDHKKTFYYVVTEEHPGRVTDADGTHVKNSSGRINVSVTVSYNSTNKFYSYKVSSKTILDNGKEYKDNQEIGMSGVEFSLGAFFNMITTEPLTADVKISKVDVDSKELKGATLRLSGVDDKGSRILLDMDKMVEFGEGAKAGTRSSNFIEFVSGTTPTMIRNLPDGEYKLVETAAPKGYKIATEITFTVKEGKVAASGTTGSKVISQEKEGNYKVTMTDEAAPKTSVSISKKDVTGGEELVGAELKLTGKDSKGNDIEFDLSKVELGKEATMENTTGKSKEIVFFSGSEATKINELPDGKYELLEINAPKGYKVATLIKFEIKDGVATLVSTGSEVLTGSDGSYKLTVFDEAKPTVSLNISKKSVTGSGELAGAKLKLTGKDAEGNAVEFDVSKVTPGTDAKVSPKSGKTTELEITSGTSATLIEGLVDGTYELEETYAPEGYKVTTLIRFKVENGVATLISSGAEKLEGSNGTYTLTVFDEAIPTANINISKKAVSGSDELPGAVLKLTGKDAEGNAVEFDVSKVTPGTDAKVSPKSGKTTELEITSGTSATLIEGLRDGVYELEETYAPEGYKVTTLIRFKVENGVATLLSSGAEKLEGSDGTYTLTVFDEAIPTVNINISKKAVTGSDELPGAVLKLTGKDADGKAVVFDLSKVTPGEGADVSPKSGKPTELEITSGTTATLIEGLRDGIYELEETNAPEGYKVTTLIKFKVENGVATLISSGAEKLEGSDGTYTLTVFDEAAPTVSINISKKAVTGDDELAGAILELTGKDAKGNAITFDVSKVTLGTDADVSPKSGKTTKLTITSGTSATKIEGLPDGTYELKETNAPEGYKITTLIRFKVEDGKANLISTGTEKIEGSNGTYTLTVFDEAEPVSTVSINISKKAVTGGDELPGAELKLTGKDAKGNAIVFDVSKVKKGADAKVSPESGATTELIITSGSSATKIEGLPDGTYELEETNAPKGYKVTTLIKFKVENGVATLISSGTEKLEGSDGTYTLTVFDEAAPTVTINISKKDVSGGDELSGAVLELTGKDAKDNAIEFDVSKVTKGEGADVSPASGTTTKLTITSGSSATKIEGLLDGTYELKETAAPNGYKVTTLIKFKVENGVASLISTGAETLEGSSGTYTLTVFDEAAPTVSINISKKDISGGDELAGAVLELTGKDAKDNAIEFDASKVALGTDAKVSPASGTATKLTITSGKSATKIEGLPDGTYELKETAAPKGYKLTTLIKFKVENGVASLISSGSEKLEGSAGTYTLTVFDEAAPTVSLNISKKDISGGKELPGATLELTGKDAKGNAIEFDVSKVETGEDAAVSPKTGTTKTLTITSGKSATKIAGLPDGTYELKETDAPKGYKITTVIKFEVKDGKATLTSTGVEKLEGSDGTYTLTVFDEAAPTVSLNISKTDVTGSKELPGAILELTGKDAKGNAIEFDVSKVTRGENAKVSPDSGTTKTLTITSGESATKIEGLLDGTYELVETFAPKGYKIATTIKFEIKNGAAKLISQGAEILEGKDGNYKLTVVDEAKTIEGSSEVTIDILKSVVNQTPGSTLAISKEGYEFTLTGTSENVKGKVYKGTTDADGRLSITISDYKATGTYEYELKESEGLRSGVTYDKTVYKVAVTVEADADSKLISPATVVVTKKSDSSAVSQPVKFENTYKAASVKAEIKARKTYTGEGATLKDGQFGFTISKKGETAVLASARNKADGSISFTLPAYTTPGKYEYVIREVKGSEPGITYDASEFEVTVTVSDDGSGTLKAVVSGSAAEREFKNTYEKKSVSENDATFSLKLKKELSGDWSNDKNLKAGDYSFELTIQGKSYYESNKADGSVEFTDIVISGGDGEYDFTLKEVIPEPKVKGMTYDETVVEGKVSVKDGKATITAPAGDIVFTNKFTYEPSRFDVSLNKVISQIDGKSLEGAVIKFSRDDETFDLRDSRVTVTQNGEAAKDLEQTKNYISFTTTDTITVISGIASGVYTMSEVTAPEGYKKADDIKITIDENGNVTASNAMNGAVVVMIDDPLPTEPTPTPVPDETTPTPTPEAEEPTPSPKPDETTPTPTPAPGDVTPTPAPGPDELTPTPTTQSTPTPTPKSGRKKVTPTPGGGSGTDVTPTPTPDDGGDGRESVTPTPGGGGSNRVTPTPPNGKGRPTPTPFGGNGGGNGGNGGNNGRGLDRSPQTGDHNTAGVFAVAGLISLAALAVVTIIEKKKKEEQ